MASVIDRRSESGEGFRESRRRFMERQKGAVKKAIEKNISERNLKDIDGKGIDVNIPRDGIREPFIHHGKGGINRRVLPGNKKFSAGDRIKRPDGGGGGGDGDGDSNGNRPGEDGEGLDDFVFTLSQEEFLEYLYEDLQLPNLTKQTLQDTTAMKFRRAGFVTDGPPNKIDLSRSKSAQKVRHMAFQKPQDRKILAALEEQKSILLGYDPSHILHPEEKNRISQTKGQVSRLIRLVGAEVASLREKFSQALSGAHAVRMEELDAEIALREKKKKLVPTWNDSTDLVYRNHEKKPVPAAKAVMFCLMDVSGSMTQDRKNNAKLFYFLLYRFLEKKYNHVDVVFIRHTTEADEVDEKTFFYDGKTGGTQVSTVIAKMKDVMAARYPASEWNIYGAQASDGENITSDNPECARLLNEIMKSVQAYFYTDVGSDDQHRYPYYNPPPSLWDTYEEVADQHEGRFFMGKIRGRSDIWPVFREFFKKRENEVASQMAVASDYAPRIS